MKTEFVHARFIHATVTMTRADNALMPQVLEHFGELEEFRVLGQHADVQFRDYDGFTAAWDDLSRGGCSAGL